MNPGNKTVIRLPIKVDPVIKTECWMSVNLAIIQACPLGVAWLAAHFDIFIDNKFIIDFGHIDKKFKMMDFNDLLDYSEINYLKVPPNKIIDLLIFEIENNNYISLFLTHFYLVYGFDKEKSIFNVLLGGKECLFTFSEIEDLYIQYCELYRNNPDAPDVVELSFFPITRIKLRESYNTQVLFYEISKRFRNEIEGKKYSISEYNGESFTEPEDYYTGLGCLLIMEIRVFEYIRDKEHLIATKSANERAEEMKKNFNKLYEHRNVILMVMKWLVSLYKNVDENIYNAISIYEECRSTMRMIANMSIKFALKLDWDILLRMQKILKGEYEKEKEALESFHSFIYSADAQKRAQDGMAQI